MKKILIVILKILLMSSPIAGFTQNIEYVVIKIIKNNNSKLDDFCHTQWLIPVDSLKKINFNSESIFPLLIQDFSYDNLSDCSEKRAISPFNYTNGTSFTFPDSITNNLNSISELVTENKKLIQVIKKKWVTGFKESVKIYASPIKGNFCYCNSHEINNEYFGKTNYIFLGKNKITLNPNFWDSEAAKTLRSIDFSSKNKFSKIWY